MFNLVNCATALISKESQSGIMDAIVAMLIASSPHFTVARGGFKAESLVGHITRRASPLPPLPSLSFPPSSPFPSPPLLSPPLSPPFPLEVGPL